jgi:hypothetical protein
MTQDFRRTVFKVAEFSLVTLALATLPSVSLADSCTSGETQVQVRGQSFDSITLQLKQGSVRIGSLDFSFFSDSGWVVSRRNSSGSALGDPATQITVADSALEVRSLDRRVSGMNSAPDVVLTGRIGVRGPEIQVLALGEAFLDAGCFGDQCPISEGSGSLAVGNHPQKSAGAIASGLKRIAFGCQGLRIKSEPGQAGRVIANADSDHAPAAPEAPTMQAAALPAPAAEGIALTGYSVQN